MATVTIPRTAAGAGPRKTMAMISARKLPETRTFTAPVRIACRSDAIAHAASAISSGRSRLCQSSREKTTAAPAHTARKLNAIPKGTGRVADATTDQESAIGHKFLNLKDQTLRQFVQEMLRALMARDQLPIEKREGGSIAFPVIRLN